MAEIRKREIAYKLRIGEVLRGKPILIQDLSQEQGKTRERLNFLELGDKKIVRVNVVANVIDKYESENSRFANLTIDDASGQITIRAFGDSISLFKDIAQGHTVMIIGLLRYFNNEIYILPEIIKILDPRYLLIRKLELEKSHPKQEIKIEEIKITKDQIIEMIKKSEQEGGIETEKLVMDIKTNPEIINQEIKKLLEEGIIYEPRPGIVRYLG